MGREQSNSEQLRSASRVRHRSRIADQIDRPLTLETAKIRIRLSNRRVSAFGTAILRFTPRPRVVIEFTLPSSDAAATNEMRAREFIHFQIESGPLFEATFGDEWRLGGGNMSGTLIPTMQPFTITNRGEDISKCKFQLINFPSLWGEDDVCIPKDDRGTVRELIQQMRQRIGPWEIEIQGLENTGALDYYMRRFGGSAITHIGSIARADGRDFALSDLEIFLREMHLLLSFARGSYCGFTALEGENPKGENCLAAVGKPANRAMAGRASDMGLRA